MPRKTERHHKMAPADNGTRTRWRNTVSVASSVIIPAGTKFYVGNLAFLQEIIINSAEEAAEGQDRMAGRRHDFLLCGKGRKILRSRRRGGYC